MTGKQARTLQVRDTKRRVKRALFQLMETKPYARITITELVEAAGVSRASYYNHFVTKDDVVLDTVRSIMARHIKKIAATQSYSLQAGWELLFQTFADNARIFTLIGDNNLLYLWARVMEEFQAPGAQLPFPEKEELDPATYAYYVEYHDTGLAVMAYRWLRDGCPQTPAEAAAMLARIRADTTVRTMEQR